MARKGRQLQQKTVAKEQNSKDATAGPARASVAVPNADIIFPQISPQVDLEQEVLLDDQIMLIKNFLSPAECRSFVKFIDALPLVLTPPKKRGEADRVNYRYSVTSPAFAEHLQTSLAPHLPSFPYPTHMRRQNVANLRRSPHSFNSNIRVYKYVPDQYFGAHYDDSVVDSVTGAKSEWTLLVYLTGAEDGVEGGETVFYMETAKGERCQDTIVAPLTRGTALLHRHGQECLLHQGSVVHVGTKYVLRSDLMFK
ncbi:hypothetical protein FISHEDRAFT_38567 [Fistulina hepatica ATCC 64428]|nr:hypothetical protein FISHEDRAFT_38567 [Fistulina hepatica ATCC 64428]